MDALARTYLNPGESRLLWAVLRKTYGWHKKKDRISYSQFQEMTGLSRQHISRAIKKLETRNIIIRSGGGYKISYGLQKDVDRWQLVTAGEPNQATEFIKHVQSVTPGEPNKISNTGVTDVVTAGLPNLVTPGGLTKDNKYTIKIKTIYTHWNDKGIIKHKSMIDPISRAISGALKNYGQADVCQAIDNYAEILRSDEYWFSYRWTLRDFLGRGLEKFMDLKTAQNNYRRGTATNAKTEQNKHKTRRLPTRYTQPATYP